MPTGVSPALAGWSSVPSRGRATSRTAQACYAVAALLFASGLAHLVVFAVDGGPWYGPVSWRKPATFGLAFGLTLAAVTWIARRYLSLPARTRDRLLAVFAADSVLEVTGITVQAWRGVPSHVDMQGSVNTAISMMLAVGGGILIVVLVTMAVAAFRGTPGIAPSMALALRTGFAGLLVGLAAGAGMIARGVLLARTGHQQEAYSADGFLKPLHAVGLNAIVVLPLLGWLLAYSRWDERRRTRIVAVVAWAFLAAGIGTLALGLSQL
jgi:hypothetical protein